MRGHGPGASRLGLRREGPAYVHRLASPAASCPLCWVEAGTIGRKGSLQRATSETVTNTTASRAIRLHHICDDQKIRRSAVYAASRLSRPAGNAMRLSPAPQPAPSVSEDRADGLIGADIRGRFSGEDLYLAVTVGVGLFCWVAAILIVLTSTLAH